MLKIFLVLLLLVNVNAFSQGVQWTWVSGTSDRDSPAVYGTKGIPSVDNHPEGLYEACEWTDLDGNFWLYGGSSIATGNIVNNLWKYNPSDNTWTWVDGSGSGINSVVPPDYGVQGIPSSSNTPGSRGFGIMTWTDLNNNLWLFGGAGLGANRLADLWKYSITDGMWIWMHGSSIQGSLGSYGQKGVADASNFPPARDENNATWTNSDGTLWLFGGDQDALVQKQYDDMWKYDPDSNLWTWMAGSAGANNMLTWYGIKGVESPSNTPGARWVYAKFRNGNRLYIFGGRSFSPNERRNDLWYYNIDTGNWVWESGTNLPNDPGNYGAYCEENTSFIPSNRWENRLCWTDSSGFWVFGGWSLDFISLQQQNDLFHYDLLTKKWSLVSGTTNPGDLGFYGTKGVSSCSNFPPARLGANPFTGKDGSMWLFGGAGNYTYYNDLWKFKPGAVANFSALYDTCGLFNFTDNSTSCGGVNSFLWDFGDPASGSNSIINTFDPSHKYTIQGDYNVKLVVTGCVGQKDSVVKTVSVPVTSCGEESIYVPNSFSPNGDNLNDVFYIDASGIKVPTTKIYNRWGELLFQSNDISTGWDGSYRGENVQDGVYIWMIDYTDESGSIKRKNGMLALLK